MIILNSQINSIVSNIVSQHVISQYLCNKYLMIIQKHIQTIVQNIVPHKHISNILTYNPLNRDQHPTPVGKDHYIVSLTTM